ncbi:hypothetical protein GGI13_001296 [Coemansia sp. RSA 455]|nr:hypothetical protein GGI13_001296 [Coemansia sp. RSA 455]
MNNNNMSLAAAMSMIKRLESSLELAYDMLREKGKMLTEHDNTIAEQRRLLADQECTIHRLEQASVEQRGTVNNLRHTIDEKDLIIEEQRRTNAEQRRFLDDLRRANNNKERANIKQMRTIGNLQRTMIEVSGRLSGDAQLATTVAVQGGVATDDSATDNDARDSDSALDYDDVLTDSIAGDDDDYAHATVYTDAVPHGAAMGGASPGGTSSRGSSPSGASSRGTSPGGALPRGSSPGGTSSRGSSPGGIFLHSAYPAGASSRSTSLGGSSSRGTSLGGASPGGAAPCNDAARAISGLRARAPADEIPLSPRAFKRPRPNQRVCDGAGQVVTTEDLLGVFGTIAFVDISTVADIYELAVNRPLIPTGVEPQRFAQELAGLEGFSRWRPRFAVTGSISLNGLSLLRRDNRELELLRPRVLQQLGLAQDSGAVVLSPRLYYVMFSMVAIPLERITGRVLEKVFTTLTTKKLATLKVVTRNDVRNMSPDELCVLAKAWLRKLRRFTRGAGGFRHLRESANICNANYTRLCSERGGDHTGNIAKGMLDGSSECRLLLGLTDAHDLEVLCTRFESAGDDNDESQADRLREIADEVNNQPE